MQLQEKKNVIDKEEKNEIISHFRFKRVRTSVSEGMTVAFNLHSH
jgi:hypothetical protein